MKRGRPLQRRTPLRARTALQSRTPLRSHSQLRRGPINPISDKRKSDNTERRVVVSAMRLACQGACARCGRRDLPVRGHERLARAHGGDILRPDCLLCDPCNSWCEDEPQIAAWTGWKLSTKHPHDHTLTSTQARALDGSIVEFEVPAEVVA